MYDTVTENDLIPPPSVVRDRLARNVREGDLLRRLLRLSEKAVEDRRELGDPEPFTRRTVAV
jgi:hypothetical protein